MNKSTVKSVALVLALTAVGLTVFHALGGGLSTGAWAGVIVTVSAALAAVLGRQRRCSPA